MDAGAEPRPIPNASRRDRATTPPLAADTLERLGATLAPQLMPPKPPKPYSKSQVAFLELYNMLIQPANPQPLFASLDTLLREGAADGVYSGDGTTLMHAAAMYASQMAEGADQVMRALVRAKPEQAYVASKSLGYLPLHYAACNAAPLEVIRTIFEAHPQAYLLQSICVDARALSLCASLCVSLSVRVCLSACLCVSSICYTCIGRSSYTTAEKKGLTPPALADKMGHKEISRSLGQLWERERRAASMSGGRAGGGRLDRRDTERQRDTERHRDS
eukprot:COSAG03_NODE_21_length_21000_cov_26.440649_14_plen_276_part_00